MTPNNFDTFTGQWETIVIRARSRVQPSPIGKGACVAVIIQNTFNNMDNSANNSEIMVGNATAQPYQMVPGKESPIFYITDLENIWTRVRDTDADGTHGTPVDITILIYKRKGQ